MASHDIVAQRDCLPKLQEVPFNDYDDEEETVKMVQLVKTQDPTVREKDRYVNLANILLELEGILFAFNGSK